jgi:hypothetical protein
MKKAADEQKERQELIKEQKKQSSNMSSNVEKVVDFLEKLIKNQNVPKALQEDLEWVIKTINSNQLYKGKFDEFKFDHDKEEIKAWINMISLSSSLINNSKESNKLNVFSNHSSNALEQKPSYSDSGILKNLEHEFSRKRQKKNNTQEEGEEFFEIIEENDTTVYESVFEKVDEIQFDSFAFVQIVNDKSFQFLMYRFFKDNDLFSPFRISIRKLCNFSGIIQKGN